MYITLQHLLILRRIILEITLRRISLQCITPPRITLRRLLIGMVLRGEKGGVACTGAGI